MPPHAAPSTTQLDRVAAAAVHLGTLGPRLALVSENMAAQARDQAARAKAVADNMEQLTAQLDAATRDLRTSSGHVEKALATVARIAQQTRILAINASIEAARAGEHGKPFGVVVEEVQQLALRSGRTTDEIEQRVQEMHGSIARVAAMTGSDLEADRRSVSETTSTVAVANAQMQGMAESIGQQLASADALKAMGTDVKKATDALLLGIGAFRFAVHAQAAHEVGALLGVFETGRFQRERIEQELERWISAHPHFELAYFTDAAGRQITDNVALVDGRARRQGGLGTDWSGRPWFRSALAADAPVSTDLYVSSATGQLCFTISAALRDGDGCPRGVLGADVSFQRIVDR
jgi:hypothetical protein